MLSHHELATLMLLRDTGRHLEERDPDVLALRRYELVEVRSHDRQGLTVRIAAAPPSGRRPAPITTPDAFGSRLTRSSLLPFVTEIFRCNGQKKSCALK
jgi:hypothetical protein